MNLKEYQEKLNRKYESLIFTLILYLVFIVLMFHVMLNEYYVSKSSLIGNLCFSMFIVRTDLLFQLKPKECLYDRYRFMYINHNNVMLFVFTGIFTSSEQFEFFL